MNEGPPHLIGSWKINVSRSQMGLPPFQALQTYFADGTMTETTSVLGKGTEGPGHGAWEYRDGSFFNTFVLFAFDESGEFSGTVRGRSTIQLEQPDRIRGETIIDVFSPDGNPRMDLDKAVFEGQRIKVL
jgi:hypothetical protein